MMERKMKDSGISWIGLIPEHWEVSRMKRIFSEAKEKTTTEDGKINTQLNFLSGDKLTNGQTVEFELKDFSGNVIAGETVKISYVTNGVTEKYAINTDAQGRGHLVLSGENAGSYEITLNYNGSSKYNGCTAKQTLTIIEDSSSA